MLSCPLRPGLTGSQATGTDVNNSLLQINLPQTAATIRAAVASGRSALAQLNSQGLQARSLTGHYVLRQYAVGALWLLSSYFRVAASGRHVHSMSGGWMC